MNTDIALAEAFAELEQLVPDAQSEFDTLSTRLDGLRRRRTRRAAAGGLAVAGLAAAVAAGVTVGITHATSHDLPAQAGGISTSPQTDSAPPAPQPVVRQVAFSEHLATTTGQDGITRPTIAVGAGWLPAGATLEQAGADSVTGGGSYKSWTVPYAHGGGTYQVSATVGTGSGLPHRTVLFGRGHDAGLNVVGKNLTVQGRPARLFALSTGLVVRIYVDLGSGRRAEADVFREPGQLSVATAVAIDKHVARDMNFDLHRVLKVTARLTAAPRSAKIVDAYAVFDRDLKMTSYRLDDEEHGAQVGIGGLAEKYPAPIRGGAGRDVQGHPSLVIHSKGQTILYIKGLFGRYTKLISGTGAETLKDLYLIADGIRAVS